MNVRYRDRALFFLPLICLCFIQINASWANIRPLGVTRIGSDWNHPTLRAGDSHVQVTRVVNNYIRRILVGNTNEQPLTFQMCLPRFRLEQNICTFRDNLSPTWHEHLSSVQRVRVVYADLPNGAIEVHHRSRSLIVDVRYDKYRVEFGKGWRSADILNHIVGGYPESWVSKHWVPKILEVSGQVYIAVLNSEPRTLCKARYFELSNGGIGLSPRFVQRVINGFPLLASIMDGKSEEGQGKAGYDYGEPIVKNIDPQYRSMICAACIFLGLLCSFIGFWLVQKAGLCQNISTSNLAKVFAGCTFILLSWCLVQAGLSILDFGKLYWDGLI